MSLAAADLLDKTADAIEERGWGQHDYANIDGSYVCFLGAVGVAHVGRTHWFQELAMQFTYPLTYKQWLQNVAEHDAVVAEAVGAFGEHVLDLLEQECEEGISDGDYLPVVWNDRVAKSRDEAVATIRAAALVLRAEAVTEVAEAPVLVTA